jgi:Protein of unknown function (DUF4058)
MRQGIVMGSPFPGMDPYIEATHLWGDFHANLIPEIQRILAERLPDRYVVRAAERSYVALAQREDEEEQGFVPDITVARGTDSSKRPRKPKGPRILESEPGPVITRAMIPTEYRETFLEIRQVKPERKLVTGIEVLSPSNKRPHTKGWRLYNLKRLAYLSGHANCVEIDLLRRGRRMPMVSAWPDSPYYMLVCRKKQASRCSVWPAFFTKALPSIPVPLAPPDADISLDIQPLIAAVYERSRYEQDIDYHQPLSPPLSVEDAAWVQARIR